ncbi:anhydro-N-acetylmuramic acid kinase [Pseudoalteromonas sp. T1lg48]|uniref:anhydro-N-acetylmuramic acid kinase n=1 Tax=Pseudoalteromonas sp. T1lg48 TaxID=2077100 RepID=UPI000CF64534|nr:anhydro-N-acetylmuramic acid kinase [Pseudoalteromonas sp. T1lg48]
MHAHIERLYGIAAKPERIIIGLMSGTSMDGLDVALCRVRGAGTKTQVEVLKFTTCPYPDSYQQRVRQVFAKREIDLQHLTLINPWIGQLHGQLVNECLARWHIDTDSVDVIASHGQTVFHCPQSQHGLSDFGNATLQLGDGCHLARTTGIITLSDFRQKHIAAGGEGAPLAAYGDYWYFASNEENRVLLNIGGIANITVLAKNAPLEQTLCADIGPGNTMLDAYVQRYFAPLEYDQDSKLAKRGKVDPALLQALTAQPFLAKAMPKTTGPEVFNLAYLAQCQKQSNTQELNHHDVLATLCEFAALAIAKQLNVLAEQLGEIKVYASGGGIHNPLLMARIRAHCRAGISLDSLQLLGIEPDAKEAVLFALLANETLAGSTTSDAGHAGMPAVSMGKVSFPD